KSGIDITYKTETGNTYDAAKNALVLTFSRLNGSFNPITTSDGNEYVKYINIQATGNSKYSKVIRLYSKTGEYKIVDAQGSEDNEE
ncbi:MAG: hypothetical protein K5644_00310, partial [Lachnospiraceae bacterium]|nr:hypothetical protein [Lachnospiraceae bacterium]